MFSILMTLSPVSVKIVWTVQSWCFWEIEELCPDFYFGVTLIRVIHHITYSSTVSSQKFTYTLQNKPLHQGSTK